MDTVLPPVLVVDDDTNIRKMLREILALEGYASYGATNGEEALAHLRRTSSGMIVLLGIVMPVMDGRAVLREVMADTTLATRHRYIIVTGSRWPEEPEAKKLLARLDAPVVYKPFTMNDILNAIEHVRVRFP